MNGQPVKRTSLLGWAWECICGLVVFSLILLGSGILVVLIFHRWPRGPVAAWTPGITIVLGMTSVLIRQRRKREAIAYRNAVELQSEGERMTVRAGEEGRVVAEFSTATLAGSDLSGRQLQGASFWAADLRSVDLSNSDLQDAWFRDAVASAASFRGANLKRADLERSDLRGCDLRGADLREASLAGASLQSALYDRTTRWPRRFNPIARGCTYQSDAEQELPIPASTPSVVPTRLPIASGEFGRSEAATASLRVEQRP